MKSVVIGVTGYIGSHIAPYYDTGVSSQNVTSVLEQEWDQVIVTAPASSKFEINMGFLSPDISDLIRVLRQVVAKEIVLVSSISVDSEGDTPYGQHIASVLDAVVANGTNYRVLYVPHIYDINAPKGLIRDLLRKHAIYVRGNQLPQTVLETYYQPLGQDWWKLVAEPPFASTIDASSFWKDGAYDFVTLDGIIDWIRFGTEPVVFTKTKTELVEELRKIKK